MIEFCHINYAVLDIFISGGQYVAGGIRGGS